MHDLSNPEAPGNPGLSATVDPMEVFWFLRAPGLAASAGLPEHSYGPALLLYFWLQRTEAPDWQAGGRPVVFATMHEAAARLDVTERTARRYAKSLREVGAWTPINTLGSGPAQGVDLSPLAEFIPRLRAISERLTALRRERRELTRKQRDASREARAHIRQMLKAGLLSHDELRRDRISCCEYFVPDRYRPKGSGSIETLEFQTSEQKRELARIEAVEAALQRLREERAPKTASGRCDLTDTGRSTFRRERHHA